MMYNIKLETGLHCYYNKRESGRINIIVQKETYLSKIKRKLYKILIG